MDDTGVLIKKYQCYIPFTCQTVSEMAVVSVISNSPFQAEILSTDFLVLSINEIAKAVKKIKHIEVVKIEYHEKIPVHTVFNRI